MRNPLFEVIQGDVLTTLRTFPSGSVQTVVTSPPYWGLRSYLPPDHPLKPFEIGTEKTPQEYVEKIVGIFREVRRVLRDDGTCWLNLGDCYAAKSAQGFDDSGMSVPPGMKAKDLVGIPWTVALALRADGWWLRSDIVWAKGTSHQKAMKKEAAAAMLEEGVLPEVVDRVLARWEPYVGNCMPSSVEDRPTTSHEYVFLLTKSERYFYDIEAVREVSVETLRPQAETRRQARMNHAIGAVAGGGQSSKGERAHGEATHVMRTHPAGRNMRTVWTIPTQPFPGAHFATFPERLVEPCLWAGSSAGGCCVACGAPRVRVVERGGPLAEQRAACGADAAGGYNGTSTKNHQAHGVQDASAVKARVLEGMRERRTVGWEPSCSCGADVQPCLAMDPFGGSGTVGAVALREGRDFVGIELSPENAQMARDRISDPDYAKKVRAQARQKTRGEMVLPH